MSQNQPTILAGVPEGMDALILAQQAYGTFGDAKEPKPQVVLHIVRDDRRLASLAIALRHFAPEARVYTFPAWDCVPYDRVSPSPELTAKRINTLTVLAAGKRRAGTIILATLNAVLQRVPHRETIKSALRKVAPDQRFDMGRLARRLDILGYQRAGTVMEPGEYAVRGGIMDIYPPGRANPVRLDFFGDTLESIKTFDVETQRTTKSLQKLLLMPVSEVLLSDAARKRFRQGYVDRFGAIPSDDPLYETISAGQRYQGMEHWLPLFHEQLETFAEFAEPDLISLDQQTLQIAKDRFEQVE
ncbi:MAG: transcription-repair coupling factor, partial [Pseudomonadota bacterium]